jgi:ribosome-associated protein
LRRRGASGDQTSDQGPTINDAIDATHAKRTHAISDPVKERKERPPLSTPALSTPAASTPAPTRAGERPAPVKTAKVRPDTGETLRLVLAQIDDMKAEDTVTIDLADKSSIADFMVVTSGRSNRQVGAIADHVVKALNAAGLSGIRVQGQPHCDWVVIDAGDVIVHVFRPEVRDFYQIEKMWSHGRSQAQQAN